MKYKQTRFEEGNCIFEFKEGNSFIRICDDFCSCESQREVNTNHKNNIAEICIQAAKNISFLN